MESLKQMLLREQKRLEGWMIPFMPGRLSEK